MTVDVRGVGTANGSGSATVNVTTAATPNLPAGVVSGDRVFLFAVSTAAITTPTNWTVVLASVALGGGTAADTTGTRVVAVWTRDYDGTWTMPTLTVPAVAAVAPGLECCSLALVKSPQDQWLTPTVGSGSDTTSGTGYSVSPAAFVDPFGLVMMLWAWPISPGTLSALTFSATGVTAGTFTSRVGVNGNATGSDVFLALWTVPINTGATGTHTMGVTGTVANTAGGVLVNQSVLSVVPPRAMGQARRQAFTW